MPVALAPKVKHKKPTAGPLLDVEVAEILNDALDSRHKSSDTYAEDLVEAFKRIPKENIEAAAAVCRDLGNEAVKSERWDDAIEHYTSVLSAYPQDHEVLANRAFAYLQLKRGPEALQDAALCVTLKKHFPKGYYRFGCALEECKMYKESASVFAKVVEMEPGNVEAAGRLLKARNMLEMISNVERVNDPLWMHKPEPPKSEIQVRAEEAQALNDREMNHLREEIGRACFDFDYLHVAMSKSDGWYENSMMAKGINMHLLAHSAVQAPRVELERLADPGHIDSFAEAIRAHVPTLVPSGQAGVVLLLGGTMGLLPLLALEAGANQVYVAETHGFCAKMAHAQVGRHTLLAFERENWARLPMTLGLAERTKQAGSAAFKLGKLDQAIALYTEALQAAETLTTDGELKASLLCNRSLCYLKMGEAEAALADATAAQKALPSQPKAHYRAAQALQALGRNGEARNSLAEVLSRSRANKNADAERMLAELEGLPARGPAVPRSAGAAAGKASGGGGGHRPLAREDRAQRLTVQEVNAALESRCSKVRAIHKPVDQLRLHHELAHKPDLVVLTNFDWTLLGDGLIRSVNNLKAEELLRPQATVLPAAARVWMMAVQVLPDTGVPIDSTPVERLLWAPTLRKVDLDSPHFRRTIRPLTAPTVAFAFDFRAGSPPIKPERVALDLPVVEDGRANGVVFWFEMPLGAAGLISNAPMAAMPAGARHLSLGQALQYLQPVPVSAGAQLPLDASHNRTRILFSMVEPDGRPAPLAHPRRGLVLGEQLRTLQDAALNRPLAAAVRKALFRLPANKPALVLHVGAGIGTQSVVAAQARPDVADYVVACEKSATLIDVAERVAQLNSVGDRISFLQKDCRNLKAHEDMPHKADVLVLECLDTALLSEGILHYVQHLRGTFTAEHAAIIPAAAVIKGMLVELRSGEVHGVDMTMADAYRWSKDARPVHLRDGEYTQLSDVFDIFVFDFASSALEQQVENLEIVISRDGIVSALVFWFDLILDEDIIVSTSPFVPPEQELAFGQGLVYLQPAETRVKRGATLPLLAAHNSLEMMFTIEEDKLTRKGSDCELLPHTRFDPRWEGARVNLDDQWKKIIQGLGANPKDAAQLQEGVMRFAAQSAAFGIDTRVAERCALTFLTD